MFRRIALIGSLLAAIGLGALLLFNPSIDVPISLSTIQGAIDNKLPFTGSKAKVDYTVTSAQASILPDGRIGIETEITFEAMGRQVTSIATGSGVPRYSMGSFYVDAFSLDEVRLAPSGKEPGLFSKTVRSLGLLEEGSFLDSQRDTLVAKVKEAGTDLIGGYLDRTPVYTLKTDLAQSSLRLALQDVKVTADTLVITLSPLSLLMRLAMMAGVAILTIGVVIATFRNPSLLIGISLAGVIGS